MQRCETRPISLHMGGPLDRCMTTDAAIISRCRQLFARGPRRVLDAHAEQRPQSLPTCDTHRAQRSHPRNPPL